MYRKGDTVRFRDHFGRSMVGEVRGWSTVSDHFWVEVKERVLNTTHFAGKKYETDTWQNWTAKKDIIGYVESTA